MRFQYVLNEAATNIRRNALVVLGAVLAVFVSLVLVFGSIVMGEIARVNTTEWQDDVRVIAFLRDDFREIEELQATVAAWPEVGEVFYFSKADGYQEALELFKDDSAVLRVIEENPQIVPASLRVRPVDLEEYSTIEQRLTNSPGVVEVRSAGPAVDQIVAIRDGLGVFFWVLGVMLGIAAVALIANTIHMAIYARREELEIMKLVGASNTYVRTPFLLEGIIEGVIGALLAVLAVFGLYRLALNSLVDLPNFIDIEIGFDYLRNWGIIVLLFGLAVGLVGSSISLAVHRYIRS
jgi:cell division transport system permease protein